MTIELTMLALATGMGLLHLLATGMVTTTQFGIAYGLSSRDEKREPTGMGARLVRAYANFMQSFPFFIAAVVAAALANRHSTMTVYGAELYLAARLIYIPCYVFNVIGVRTLAYIAGIVGIVMVLSALL